MKIYLAGGYSSKHHIRGMGKWLQTQVNGIEFTSRWLEDTKIENLRDRAHTDYGGIDDADILVASHPYGYGTSSEMGYALGSKKPVIYLVDNFCFKGLDTMEDELLPAGMLTVYKYEDDFAIRNQLSNKYKGFIVNNLEDLVKILKNYSRIYTNDYIE